jgi:hypothetical protein
MPESVKKRVATRSGAARDEDTAFDDVEVVEIVRLTS